MALITNTAGGSGSTALGSAGPVTLFTTPNTPNAIFIVYLFRQSLTAGTTVVGAGTSIPMKMIVGPNAAVIYPSGTSETGSVVWNWVQMEIQ